MKEVGFRDDPWNKWPSNTDGQTQHWTQRSTGSNRTKERSALSVSKRITDGPSPLQVIFDPVSNMTYVTSTPGAVPEIDPNTAHGAGMLLVGAAGILERRLRRVALARQCQRPATPRRSLFSLPLR